MARYSFEINPVEPPNVSLVKTWNPIRDRIFNGTVRQVILNEIVTGSLVISDLEGMEAEAVKRGMFAGKLKTESSYNQEPLDFTGSQKANGLREIRDHGQLTTKAIYNRRGRGEIYTNSAGVLVGCSRGRTPSLPEGNTRTYAGNLVVVRDASLDTFLEGIQNNNQVLVDRYAQIAETADRMSHEIVEEVGEQLVTVSGLTLAALQDRVYEASNPMSAS